MKFPVRGEAGFLFLLMMKNFTHPVISLRGTHWKCLMIPEPSQRRQDIKEWLTDRQTDSELHVKSPFPFKKKITLKHRRTRRSTHTRIPTQRKDPTTPPPHLSMVKYCLHLKTYTLLHPSFFKSSLFHFFFSYSSNGSCSSITRHVFASLELVGVFGDRLMTARLSGSNESHCSFTRTDT